MRHRLFPSVLVFVLASVTVVPASAALGWQFVQDPSALDTGTGYAFAIDGIHRQAYAFGGTTGAVLYRQDLDDPELRWRLLGSAPVAQVNAQAMYDRRRGRLLVVGGESGPVPQSTVWAWDPVSGTWSKPPVTGQAPSRVTSAFPLTYDMRRDRLLYVNDAKAGRPAVWTLELAGDTLRWSSLPIAGGPALSPNLVSAAYDSLGDRLFLAVPDSLYAAPADSDGAFAPLLQTENLVKKMGMIVDPVSNRLAIIGFDSITFSKAALVIVDLATFATSFGSLAHQPPIDWLRAFGEDPIAHTMVAMSILPAKTPARSILEMTQATPAWSTVHPAGLPYTHQGMAGAADPVGRWVYVYGGESHEQDDCAVSCSDCTCLSQKLHRISLDGPLVYEELILPGPSPGPRTHMAAAYDSAGSRILFYGGEAPGGIAMNDCWALELLPSPHWSSVAVDTGGPAGLWPLAVFDPSTRSMVLSVYVAPPDGTSPPYTNYPFWRLDLSHEPATWTHFAAGIFNDAVQIVGYDRVRHRILGITPSQGVAVEAAGTVLLTPLDPIRRAGIYGAFDTRRNYLICYGGFEATQSTLFLARRSNAFGGASFLDMQAGLSSPVPPDVDGLMVYDSQLDRVMVVNGLAPGPQYGGHPGFNPSWGIWTLQLDATVPVLPGPVSALVEDGAVRVRFFGHVESGSVVTERSTSPGDTWSTIGEATALSPNVFEYVDRSAVPGQAYRYRFRYRSEGSEQITNPTDAIAVPAVEGTLALAIEGGAVGRGWPLLVHARLAGSSRAELVLFDVTGRRVAGRILVGEAGASTTASLAPARPAPGVYFLRLTQGGHTEGRRIVRF